MTDLRTENEIKIDAKRERIINTFKKIDQESGYQYSTWRICQAVSKELKTDSVYNVYGYIVRANLRSYADRHKFDRS